MRRFILFIQLFLFFAVIINAQNSRNSSVDNNTIVKHIVYKTVDTTQLKLKIIYPQEIKKKNPTVVFFCGGGWKNRNIDQFLPHSNELAKLGVVSILVEYRVEKINKTTPIDALRDARDAMKFIHLNSKDLQVDTERIITAGGSAGGHLAAAVACIDSFDDKKQSIDITPKAMVLFNPVINNGPDGYGYDRVKSYYKEFSPAHNIKEGMPPTLFMVGTNDTAVPMHIALDFQKQMIKKGNRCDLYLYSDQKHSFFNHKKDKKNPYYCTTLSAMIAFIRDLDLLEK